MSEDSHDDTVMVQGDVGETIQGQDESQQEEERRGTEAGDLLQPGNELEQRVIARQEEKGKGDLSAAKEEQEREKQKEAADSKLLLAGQQRRRTKKNTKKWSKQKEKEKEQQQPNLYDLSKQLENNTKQLSWMVSVVQQLPKYLKNADTQSRIIKQLNSSMNQLQKQIRQIQKSVQMKKSRQK